MNSDGSSSSSSRQPNEVPLDLGTIPPNGALVKLNDAATYAVEYVRNASAGDVELKTSKIICHESGSIGLLLHRADDEFPMGMHYYFILIGGQLFLIDTHELKWYAEPMR